MSAQPQETPMLFGKLLNRLYGPAIGLVMIVKGSYKEEPWRSAVPVRCRELRVHARWSYLLNVRDDSVPPRDFTEYNQARVLEHSDHHSAVDSLVRSKSSGL